MATNKYFKCPYCDKKFTREDLCRHLEKKHLDELPEGFTPLRVTFHVVNRKDMSYRRPCRVCKQPTEWDEVKGRYNFLCGSRQCYETHVEKMRSDMGDKIGINRQTATAEGLEKMLAGRRISGKYRFRDGHEVNYTGSYELKALEFFDKIMYIKPEDLMVPGPALKYELDGVNHIYIPDMYYIPYNLIIEVKTGGDRPNTNPQWKETRRKQIAKEKFIVEKTDYNYIRLTNNEFNQILSVFADLKMSSMEDDPYRVVHINEHVSSISPMIGMNDTIIVNYRQNNAFSSKYKLAISDSPTFDSIFTTDTDNKLIKLDKSFLSECKYSTYILKDSKDRINSILKEGEEVVDLYEAIFNHKQYTIDQIYFEKGIIPYEDIYNKALFIEESIYDYIRNGDETNV